MVRTTRCPTYSTISPRRVAAGSAPIGIGAGCITSSRSGARRRHAAEIDEQYIEGPFRRMKEAPHLGGYQHITAEEWAAMTAAPVYQAWTSGPRRSDQTTPILRSQWGDQRRRSVSSPVPCSWCCRSRVSNLLQAFSQSLRFVSSDHLVCSASAASTEV